MSRGRPFQPGNQMGRGRPRGSRNQSSATHQKILAEYADPLIRKCIAMALKENPVAMRACMERLLPLRREQPVQFKLPKVRTSAEADEALNMLLRSVARGQLTPTETKQIAEILDGKRRMIETVELEQRIQMLESNLAESDGKGK
jgi:hypothetical protein